MPDVPDAEVVEQPPPAQEPGWGEWLLSWIPFVGSLRRMFSADLAGQREANWAAQNAVADSINAGEGNATQAYPGRSVGSANKQAMEGVIDLYGDFATTATGLAAAGAAGVPKKASGNFGTKKVKVSAPGSVRPTITPKIQRDLPKRGWTPQQIDEAVRGGYQVPAINKATGNPAIRYVHPTTGQSVVIDRVTGEVIHVGGPGFDYGIGTGDVPLLPSPSK